MRRIGLVVIFTISLVLAPLAAGAQQVERVPRIAFITTTSPPGSPAIEAFREALHALGYVEDQNIRFEARFASAWQSATTDFDNFA